MSRKDDRKTIAYLQNDVDSQKHQIDVLYRDRTNAELKHAREIKSIQERHQSEVAAVHREHQSLLDDLLLLEPHLKHYRTDSPWALGADWDRERIIRAANHLRGEQALESLGYTNAHLEAAWADNVISVDFRGPNPEGAA